ncbi:MAG: nucleotidyltransferase family protein [Candidatus Methylomirabilaceae bacterium]
MSRPRSIGIPSCGWPATTDSSRYCVRGSASHGSARSRRAFARCGRLARRSVAISVMYQQQVLGEIAAAFDDRRVPFVLLKGEALSKGLYPQEALPPYGDIDLLIQPESYEAAKEILVGLGFRLRLPSKEEEKLHLFGEIEFDRKGPVAVMVNLHWDTLMASWEPRSLLSRDETWNSVDRISLGPRGVLVLRGEVLLLYLCVHFAFHHVFDGLLWLCDLSLLLRRDAVRFDWDHLITMANRCQCRRAAYYSLLFAHVLMAAKVPFEVLERLRPLAFVRALMPAGHLLFRDTRVPQMLERYVKFLLIDTQEGRVRALQAWLQTSKKLLERR